MLARIQQIEGIDSASVDFGGHFLRLSGTGTNRLGAAIAVLRELGYEPESVAADDSTPTRWFDVSSVDQLSIVEAEVIARRVVDKLRARVTLSPDAADRLREGVTTALRKCFTERDTRVPLEPGQFRAQCVDRATDAARHILSPSEVAEFVATLAADLDEDHTHDAGL